MKYIDMITTELFSDDELTNDIHKDRAATLNKTSVSDIKHLHKQINDLTKTTFKGFSTVLHAIEEITQKSKEILIEKYQEKSVAEEFGRSLM